MKNESFNEQFPLLLNKTRKNNAFVYLDNAATSQKPQRVIDAICNFYTHFNANVHRGLYQAAEQATTQYEAARDAVAKFIHAKQRSEIVFTKGCTEAINLVAHSWGKKALHAGDVILLSRVEHHANLLPWLELAREKNLHIRYIPYDKKTKKLSLAGLDLTGVKLLAVQHISNVLGNVWDDDFVNLANLIDTVQRIGAAVLIDAAQSIAHVPIDVQALKCDFLVFSGHKIYAPTGIGVLYVNAKHHSILQPYQVGGSMMYHATYEQATWAAMPHLLEAGTPPISSALGLHAALRFVNETIDFTALADHETALCLQLVAALKNFSNIHLVTNHDTHAHQHIVSFYHETIHAHDLASFLGEQNIAVRAGNHCAEPLINLIGVPALVRVSVAAYTTKQDIDRLVHALAVAIKHLT